MIKRIHSNTERRGRRRPLLSTVGSAFVALALMLGTASTAFGHAEPERANPPIDGTVPAPPGQVEIWFSQEVKSEGTTIQVIGPDGVQVDQGDTTLDLQDPERVHVTVSLRPGLEAGTYTVQWVSVSGADGDQAQGSYVFHVEAASPVASPAASPAATPVVTATEPSAATGGTTATTDPTSDEDNFDSRAFGISVGVGLVAAALIFAFWRLVRPKNPVFRD